MDKINRGRQTPGMASIPPMGGHAAPAHSATGPGIQRKHCLCGPDVRNCMLAIVVEGRVTCSIKILAKEALKSGIKIGRDEKNTD